MNSIADRQLDQSERQVIYELTMKKRQSKKSTMSEKHLAAKQQLAKELLQELKELQELRKESSIKQYKNRLEHLNGELERRLYQYEYLVKQEKALLGAYNMMLFANQGVNNFHQNDPHEPTVDSTFSSQAGTPNRLITLC